MKLRKIGFNTLALAAYKPNGEEFTVITVNLDSSDTFIGLPIQFIDTNNLSKELMNWLEENKIATQTDIVGQSGFCTYPAMRFDIEWLNSLEEI